MRVIKTGRRDFPILNTSVRNIHCLGVLDFGVSLRLESCRSSVLDCNIDDCEGSVSESIRSLNCDGINAGIVPEAFCSKV